jgi:hypothetical protein
MYFAATVPRDLTEASRFPRSRSSDSIASGIESQNRGNGWAQL